ncbi:hypothetical protein [Paenibacillus sp. DMB5]|uniref:hypothetical protein n=1 Tax=Paenibacillus sp. DMB5 TaxID=1780103 RepID=UPI00076CA529|nr:hypothetical protein [Paenibacillus sp. DMB5]KUP25792.1 hypothetical protein AWJ19_19400 [Paenibacillus sp. DMB5]
MWMTVGLLSFLASIILVITGFIYLIRKKPNKKKIFLSALACFVVFIIAVSADSSNDETAASDKSNTTESSSSEVTNVSANASQENNSTAEDEAKKEAEKKAKEEADAKAEEEKKAKKEAEEKAAAEKKAKAEAEAKELEKKSKAATIMEQLVPVITEDAAELDDKTKDYLINHYELFPAMTVETKNSAAAEVDASITSRHLFKNITPYFDKMIEVSGTIVQISEEETDFGTLASVHILNDNGDSLIGIYNGSTGDILDGDYVTLRGVPSALYSFSNVGGGTTNAILLTLSTIQKVQ